MKKYLLSFAFLLTLMISFAQNSHVAIKGKVENELKQPIGHCTLQIFRDDVLIRVDTTGENGQFQFDSLYTGHVYDIYFEAEGYSLKFIRIDVKDAQLKDLTRFPLEISMALFSVTDIQPEKLYFLQSEPYAIAKYNKTIDNLEWDMAYIEKMKKKVEAVRN